MTLYEVTQSTPFECNLSFEQIIDISNQVSTSIGGYGGNKNFKKGMQKLMEIAEKLSGISLDSYNFFALPCRLDGPDSINYPSCLFLTQESGVLRVIGALHLCESLAKTNKNIESARQKLLAHEFDVLKSSVDQYGVKFASDNFAETAVR